jgi:hypothetical protein
MIGGAERGRTADLLNAIQALSQLSYSPTGTPRWRVEGGLSANPNESPESIRPVTARDSAQPSGQRGKFIGDENSRHLLIDGTGSKAGPSLTPNLPDLGAPINSWCHSTSVGA